MIANGKGVERDLEKALALILIAKQNIRLNPNARLLLYEFQTATKGLLNTAQISRTEWQVTKLFGTRIHQGLKSDLHFPNSSSDAATGHYLIQSCCLAEREIADNSLSKGD